MKKVLYISDLKGLKEISGDYDRLYFGAEFCELNIPSIEDVKMAQDFAREHSMSFSLITPYVTDHGIGKVRELLGLIDDKENIEIIINDFGILHMLSEEDRSFDLVLGRLLVKQKRGFGISSESKSYPKDLEKHFRSLNVDVQIIAEYLKQAGIQRVELDNLLQGIDVKLRDVGLSGSLYYPYGYVTTTRFCPWSYSGSSWQNLKNECQKSCRLDTLVFDGDIIAQAIYMRGNTQFYKKDDLPEDAIIDQMGIDRLVFEPDIPL